jgi:predicted nucleic acid-binding protein
VVDASPCIGLARIGQLRLLPELFSHVLVAQSVVSELWVGDRDDRAWEIIRYVNVEVHAARPRLGGAPSVLSEADLDTIGLARMTKAVDVVIVDERAARKYAKAQGLKVMGTVGVVALATTKGLLKEARPWLVKLFEAGFRVDEALLDRTLAELGEAPLSGK